MRANNQQGQVRHQTRTLRRAKARPAFKAGGADNGIRETPMTLQNNESSGYFQSMTGQFLAFGVSIVVLVVLAAIFVF